MSTPPMLRQMRHDVWATGKLLERCRSLTMEQLQLTAPGTYGSIQKTFAHIGPRERGLSQHVRRDLAALHGAHRIG